MGALDPVRYAAAASRFRTFFEELHWAFIEREDVLLQLALALLAREHVLLTGPPGTAKSQLASAVFGRIVDETTGAPSLYARQITESTVHTDLVGPLDFKTLMETGRTEHFTDEGMLGAVHAFLDEVFDGRDMLLRTALNVLHERELKQGTRIAKGNVECALMTSNRYLADILENSRDTLLAFVDRIAFVGFVPRGFARPEHLGLVLRRQVGGAVRPVLEAHLTLQDLDVLQATVESVFCSEPVCDGLATLLGMLDTELHAAGCADPNFIPTRYLSTRTAVRAGRILRAICVYDMIFRNPDRPLEVHPSDFDLLRLHLVLSGPAPDAIELLLSRETDPHERRQLTILRTEREILDRCLARLPPISIVRPTTDLPLSTRRPKLIPTTQPTLVATDPDPLEQRAVAALASGDPKVIAELAGELVPIARGGQTGSDRAAHLVKKTLAALQEQALEAALAQGDRERPRAVELRRLIGLAASLEEGGAATQGIARWLRGKALAKIDEMATFAPGASAADLEAAAGFVEGAAERARRRLSDLEELHDLRQRLIAQGTDIAEREASRAAWERAAIAAEDDIAALLDAELRKAVTQALQSSQAVLPQILEAIAPELERMDTLTARLSTLRSQPSLLKTRVVGPRLGGLVEAALQRVQISNRTSLLSEIEALLATLRKAGLGTAIAASNWIAWSTSAVLRADREPQGSAPESLDYEGYRQLRIREQRVSNTYTLAEIALLVAPQITSASSPAEGTRLLAELASTIPQAERARAVRLDIDRIKRAVSFLERWWAALKPSDKDKSASAEAQLQKIVGSGIFKVLWDESALSRFAAEATLIAEVFSAHAEEAAVLRERLEALEQRTRQGALDLLKRRADTAWNDALRPST